MTLSFRTKWGKEMGELAGMPNHFVEKIWAGLIDKTPLKIGDYSNANYDHVNKFGKDMSDYKDVLISPKYHTIRYDPNDRWREGMDIHFVINNRTKSRFQFAPVVKCTGVQEIEIHCVEVDYLNENTGYPIVSIDRVPLTYFAEEDFRKIEQLAINDGFNFFDDFFKYFNKSFIGKIIHWTDLRY